MKLTDIIPARSQSFWKPAKVRFSLREPNSLITFEFAFKIQAEGIANYIPPILNRQGLETPVSFKLLVNGEEHNFVAKVVSSLKKIDIIIGSDHLERIDLVIKNR